MITAAEREEFWPQLPFAEWQPTAETLHMWLQIVGKIRLSLTPWINHSWHVTLYLTSRGLTTSPIPHGLRTFTIDFDFIDHQLRIARTAGLTRTLPLRARAVAEFYRELTAVLHELEVPVKIDLTPNEVPDPAIRFDVDEVHRFYEPEQANRFWRVLVQCDRLFWKFRARFCGKCSPVHFFWGSVDLAVTRFSGRSAPPHPGGVPHLPDSVAREAYAHEVSSLGFWPGSATQPAAFYSYAYPAPEGFAQAKVLPPAAFYSPDLREFLLPYHAVREADSPDDLVLAFAQSTYDAASLLGKWEREKLEESSLHPPASGPAFCLLPC